MSVEDFLGCHADIQDFELKLDYMHTAALLYDHGRPTWKALEGLRLLVDEISTAADQDVAALLVALQEIDGKYY